jgi:uncharacterized protein YecE (DUF72 family)
MSGQACPLSIFTFTWASAFMRAPSVSKIWHNRDALTFLRQEHLGYVAVDEPQLCNLLPLVPAVTSDVVYLRLHRRNPNWFGASREERYDYLYSKEDLEQMLPSIRTMVASAPLMFIKTNTCHWDQAV